MKVKRDLSYIKPGDHQKMKYNYRWVGIRLLPRRHGKLCRIVSSRKGRYLLEFEDGFRVFTEEGTFRKRGRE